MRKTNSEDAMKRSTLIVWLMGLGTALWLSSRVVDMHPTFAVAVGLAVLVFSAFAAGRPYEIDCPLSSLTRRLVFAQRVTPTRGPYR